VGSLEAVGLPVGLQKLISESCFLGFETVSLVYACMSAELL
jgi:hypothetical protein